MLMTEKQVIVGVSNPFINRTWNLQRQDHRKLKSLPMHLPQKFPEISEIPLGILENLYKCYFFKFLSLIKTF